jgi:hypothetical protein
MTTNAERIGKLRDALHEIAWYGQCLHEFCSEEIALKLRCLKSPTRDDYQKGLDYTTPIIEPWKLYESITDEGAEKVALPPEWPYYLRELDKLLTSFHASIDAANVSLDGIPRELLDDKNDPAIDRKSCQIRAMIHAAGQWAYQAKPDPKRPDMHLATMLSMVRNGFIPAWPELWDKLKTLHEMVNELFPLQKHLEREGAAPPQAPEEGAAATGGAADAFHGADAETRALAILAKRPDLKSIQQVAELAGCTREHLSRNCRRFKTAWGALKKAGKPSRIVRGSKTKDGTLEAWQDLENDDE